MKKLISLLLSLILAFSLTACGSTQTNADTVGGINEESAAMLDETGISLEEFAAMSAEEQQALLDELGIVAEHQQQQEAEKENKKDVTLDDVAAGGNYIVKIGDSMMWNSFTLYYEDGVLVKLEVSFQKNDEEEAETEVIEGDAIADYTLFFIDYTAGVHQVIDALQQQGYTNMYIDKTA